MQRQPIADDEREAMRLWLIQKRRLAREANAGRTVFVGNGTFKCTMRGNPSMPKKNLLKRLGVRTVAVLIDEFRTSKQCPCGGGELRDNSTTNDGKRVRVHKTDGVCNLLLHVDDRDELAPVNMLLATQSVLH